MVHLINISKIKVTNSVKIHVSTIITKSLANELAALEDSTFKIFLTFLWHFTDFEEAVKIVGFVVEFKLTRDLLIEGAHHCIEKFISWRVTGDDLTVMEFNPLVACGVYRDGTHTK